MNKTKLASFISNVLTGDYGNANGIELDDNGNLLLLRTDALSASSSYAFPENAAFVRFSMEEITDESIITVNEEIKADIVVETKTQWANTGHAFIPADYEDRILALETDNSKIKTTIGQYENKLAALDSMLQDYVQEEADSVINRVIAAQGNRTFTFAAITDMHYGSEGYTEGVDHACKALKYIDQRIKLDAVAVLGDYTDGMASSAYAGAVADCKDINSVLDGLRFAPNFRIQGNHDFYQAHSPATYRCIPVYSDDVVWGSKLGGYFYRDFADFQLRVICLNTAEENGAGLSCSTEQYAWFAKTLDLSGKMDVTQWQTLILSHHPLDWFPSNDSGYVFWQILDAYLNGTSWNGISFAGKNGAKIVGNIHGHTHNLLTRKIAAGQPNTTESTIAVLRMATPNACYDRNNQYSGQWTYNPFGEETNYPKTKKVAEETSFCVYCIDLDSKTIKAICYGAGYDRAEAYDVD